MTQRTANRLIIATSWALLIGSVVGWPLTSLTVFHGEEQGILGLSWLALIIGAGNTQVTAYTKRSADVAADGGNDG